MKNAIMLMTLFGALVAPLFAGVTITNWQNTKILNVTVNVRYTESVYYPYFGTSTGTWNQTEQYTLGYLETLDLIDGWNYYESGDEQHDVSWTYSVTNITEENNPEPPPSLFPDNPPNPSGPPPDNDPPSLSVSSITYSAAGGGTVHISGTASDPEGHLDTLCVLFTWPSYEVSQAHGGVVYMRWIPVSELTWNGNNFSMDISAGSFEKYDPYPPVPGQGITYNFAPPPESYYVAVYLSDEYNAGASAFPGMLTVTP